MWAISDYGAQMTSTDNGLPCLGKCVVCSAWICILRLIVSFWESCWEHKDMLMFAVRAFSGLLRVPWHWVIQSQQSEANTWSELSPTWETVDYLTNLTSIWLWFRTGGPLVGGAIVLGLNRYAWCINVQWSDWINIEIVLPLPTQEVKSDLVG